MPLRENRHPLGRKLRELRERARMSLSSQERVTKIPAVVVGSYERGDRSMSVERADYLLNAYGRKLIDVPADFDVSLIAKLDALRDVTPRLRELLTVLDEHGAADDQVDQAAAVPDDEHAPRAVQEIAG